MIIYSVPGPAKSVVGSNFSIYRIQKRNTGENEIKTTYTHTNEINTEIPKIIFIK